MFKFTLDQTQKFPRSNSTRCRLEIRDFNEKIVGSFVQDEATRGGDFLFRLGKRLGEDLRRAPWQFVRGVRDELNVT
jgi:hypothetical protein